MALKMLGHADGICLALMETSRRIVSQPMALFITAPGQKLYCWESEVKIKPTATRPVFCSSPMPNVAIFWDVDM
jgi:hypothetical protein